MLTQQKIAFKNIILWRHAQAVDAQDTDDVTKDDLARELTQKGQKQATIMANWLAQHKVSNTQLISSEAIRACQTAQALHSNMLINKAFNPGASLQQVLVALHTLDQSQDLILVGHAPWLGQLATHLLGINQVEFSIKKGAIWWLRFCGSVTNNYEILTVQTCKLL